MVHQSEGFRENLQSSWTPTDRSICIKEIGSGEDVLLPGQERQSFGRDECVKSVMDVETHVRLPSASDHSSDPGQDEGMQGNFDPGDALLVEGSVVAGAASDGGTGTFLPSSTPEHSGDLNTGRPLPSLQKLKLTVWLMCGKHSESKEQITPWQNSTGDPGGVLQRPNMHVHGETGQSGVGDSLYRELRQL